MATYKVKATYSVDVEIEVDAASEKEAISKVIQKDFRDVVDEGNIWRADSENETAEISEANYKVKVKSVDYDVSFNDCWDEVEEEHPGIDTDSEEFDKLVWEKVKKIKDSLPQEFVFEFHCEPEDVDQYVADYITDDTNWLVTGCEYEILEVK